MNFGELEYSNIAAWITSVAYVILVVRYPSSSVFAFIATWAYGYGTIAGPVKFAHLLFLMQFLTFLILFLETILRVGTKGIVSFLLSPISIFGWFMVIIWLKILLETVYYGYNFDRSLAIKNAPVQVILPCLIMLLCVLRGNHLKTLNGVFLGMVVFTLIPLLMSLTSVISEGRIIAAINGQERLTLWGLDTIRSGSVFLYFAIGVIGLTLTNFGRETILRFILWSIVILPSGLLVLNASRQHLLTLAVAIVIALVIYFKKSIVFATAITLAFGGSFYFFGGGFAESATTKRLTSDAIQAEATVSRGAIWRDAFTTGFNNPIAGIGFRNFGETTVTQSGRDSELISMKDTAHGFYQEIWAEHGIIFFLLIVSATAFVFIKLLGMKVAFQLDDHRRTYAYLAVTIMLTCFFSGTVYGSIGPYVLIGITPFLYVCIPVNTLLNQEEIERRAKGSK